MEYEVQENGLEIKNLRGWVDCGWFWSYVFLTVFKN
jgi:hypothetical protein